MSLISKLILPSSSERENGRHLVKILLSLYLIFNNPALCMERSNGLGVSDADVSTQNSKRAGSVKSEDSNYWYKAAQSSLREKIETEKKIETLAKNVIFFLGHGMGVSTVTAARIFKGQQEGSAFGEEAELNFEQLPNVGLSKTFCLDQQVADSPCAATAFLCGTLANSGTVGLTSNVLYGDCRGQMNRTNQVTSALAWAQARAMSTGVVTTYRVTHATPAAPYAHVANSYWENDMEVKASGENPDVCDDIGEQLVLGEVGRRINVVLGGGRGDLTPNTVKDVESGEPGIRLDGKNLIQRWGQTKNPETAKYVWNKQQLMNLNRNKTDYLLGLFSYGRMDYVVDADKTADPSLAEMTKVAIDILSRNPKGYFLYVVGALIDIAHHENKAQKALIETVAIDDAVLTAIEGTSEQDTLLLVSADHSQVMTISGYPPRGNPILGFAGNSDVDGLPYTTLSYANGPGYKQPGANGERYDLTKDPIFDLEYRFMAGLPLDSSTHGGEDVAIYARGPFSHLLTGVNHQSFIPHLIAYAACLDMPIKGQLRGTHCPPKYVAQIPSHFANGTFIPPTHFNPGWTNPSPIKIP